MQKIIVAVIILILVIAAVFMVYRYVGAEKEETEMLIQNKLAYRNITDDEAMVELELDKSIIVLDVRSIEEYQEVHIPNSILIPLNELENRALSELPDKQAKIFIYCRTGVRSSMACKILIDLEYTNVYDMGGIVNWKYETE